MTTIDAIHTLIFVLATFLVTEGAKAIANQFGRDLSSSVSAIVAALVGLILVLVDPLLASIPAGAEPLILGAVNLVLVVFSAFGLHRTAVRVSGHVTQAEKRLK